MYEVGQKVRVSNGQPKPPARFNRKLERWESENFNGVIERVEEPRDYQPNGALVINRPDVSMPGLIEFSFHLPIGGRYQFEVIE